MAKSYSLAFVTIFLLTLGSCQSWNRFPLIICNCRLELSSATPESSYRE